MAYPRGEAVPWPQVARRGSPSGTYPLRARVTDIAGNEGTESATVIVENVAPPSLPGDANRDGSITADEVKTKNEWVMTARDSLFQTFQRAIDNYRGGLNAPHPPALSSAAPF